MEEAKSHKIVVFRAYKYSQQVTYQYQQVTLIRYLAPTGSMLRIFVRSNIGFSIGSLPGIFVGSILGISIGSILIRGIRPGCTPAGIGLGIFGPGIRGVSPDPGPDPGLGISAALRLAASLHSSLHP